MRSFSYKGISKENVFILKDKDLPVIAPVKHELLTIPKRAGALHTSTSTNVRVITLPIGFTLNENQTFSQMKEELAQWLVSDEPAPLILDEEPNRTYFALLDEIDSVEEIGGEVGLTSVRFVCPDPYKYSDEKTISLPSNINPYNIENLGSVETYPITRLEVRKKLNFFTLLSDNDFLQVGQEGEVDTTVVEPETIILHDTMATTTGWGQGTYVDNGYISGEIVSDGTSFYQSVYGTVIEPPNWQGGALKTSLSKALTNFKAEALVEMQNTGGKTGMIEIYFLDSANRTVAKIGIEDRYSATELIKAKARIGEVDTGKWIANEEPNKAEYWNDFKGVLRIERNQNLWQVYFSTIDENGNHTFPKGTNGILSYYDSQGTYGSPITQVQVSFRIYPNTNRATMKINDLKVWELNSVPVESVQYIADIGDVLEFDHYKNIIKKNGEIVLGMKNFTSNFFPLKPNNNSISVLPSDAGNVTLSFRERYL
ncbi:phage tail family protein [Aeromicrobium ponti]|uniref:Putative phage tail component-like protein n=1 Tax=Cytobacillus oceanisediminis TaxID=665099 RepID=A0A562JCV4_9BACI|nr:distal tail protein Dit [Cytobacillus oceanisediminis]TWH80991.1 putative phage tail component-like protein [Cytobacillus oceanisediminis]